MIKELFALYLLLFALYLLLFCLYLLLFLLIFVTFALYLLLFVKDKMIILKFNWEFDRMCFVFLNGFTRIQKRIHTNLKMKHEVLDSSFEMLEWWWWWSRCPLQEVELTVGGAIRSHCYKYS